MRTGYKVVHVSPSYLESAIIGSPGNIEYIPNKPTSPSKGCGPLTVFRDLVSAVRWLPYLVDEYQFWECIFKPWNKSLPGPQVDPTACWCGKTQKISASKLPAGTILAREVTLTKRVPIVHGVIPLRQEYLDVPFLENVRVFKTASEARLVGFTRVISCGCIMSSDKPGIASLAIPRKP